MRNKGFTLLELMTVIAIIGLLAVVIIPNLGNRSSGYERKATIAKLNGLVQFALKNALITNKIHKIKFNLKEGEVSVEIATDQYERGEPTFKTLERTYVDTNIEWPNHLEIKQFFIEGIDEIKFCGRTDLSLWFYIMPDDLSQNIIINFVDTKDILPDGKSKPFGLVLNPFSAQFKIYDTFQK